MRTSEAEAPLLPQQHLVLTPPIIDARQGAGILPVMKATMIVLAVVLGGCGGGGKQGEPRPPSPPESATLTQAKITAEVQANILELCADGLWYEADTKEPFTGTAVSYFPSGEVETKTKIRNGRLHGTQTKWSPKGEKVKEQEFRGGQLHGRQREWHPIGTLSHEAHHMEGWKHGRDTFWHENGEKSHEVKFDNGREDGPAIWWHKNGQKERQAVFHKGVLMGRETQWYSKGQKMHDILWDEGKVVGAASYLPDGRQSSGITNGMGVITSHYLDGTKKSEDHYMNGLREGPAKLWLLGGLPQQSTSFKAGVRHGSGTRWYSNGKVEWKATWTNGVVTSRQHFTRNGNPAPPPTP